MQMDRQSSKSGPHVCERAYTQFRQSSLTAPISGTQSETHALTCGVVVSEQSQNAVQTSRARCSGGTVHATSASANDTPISRIAKIVPRVSTGSQILGANRPNVPHDANAVADDDHQLAGAWLVEDQGRARLFCIDELAARGEPADVCRFDK